MNFRIRHFEFKCHLALLAKVSLFMYSHLSKREKKKKLAQARKRAIIWSAQQQTLANLRNTTSNQSNKAQSTTTHQTSVINREHSLKPPHTPETSFYTPISLSDNNVKTIQAIEQTLQDLHSQKEAINTTIDVLERRLRFLLNSNNPNQS